MKIIQILSEEIWTKWNNMRLWQSLLVLICWANVKFKKKYSGEKSVRYFLCWKKESTSNSKYQNYRLIVEFKPRGIKQEIILWMLKPGETIEEGNKPEGLLKQRLKIRLISMLTSKLEWRQQPRKRNSLQLKNKILGNRSVLLQEISKRLLMSSKRKESE